MHRPAKWIRNCESNQNGQQMDRGRCLVVFRQTRRFRGQPSSDNACWMQRRYCPCVRERERKKEIEMNVLRVWEELRMRKGCDCVTQSWRIARWWRKGGWERNGEGSRWKKQNMTRRPMSFAQTVRSVCDDVWRVGEGGWGRVRVCTCVCLLRETEWKRE